MKRGFYDHRNRLIHFERFDNAGTIIKQKDFSYNANDLLVTERDGYFVDGVQSNTHTVHSTYRGDEVDLVFNENNLTVRRSYQVF